MPAWENNTTPVVKAVQPIFYLVVFQWNLVIAQTGNRELAGFSFEYNVLHD